MKEKWIDINVEKFHEDYCAVSKAMIRFLRHGSSIPQEDDGAVRFDDLMEEFKAKFDGTSQWSINAWITFLARGGGPKKRFQHCLNPNSSKHFLYFRAIQGHSGGNLVDLVLQDNVLLWDEIYSITRSGLIPGGESFKRNRQSDGRRSKNGRSSIRFRQTKDRTIQKYLETSSKQSVLVQFKARTEERIAVHQTRSHAIVFCNTPPAIGIEEAVCMKTKEELYQKVCQSPRLPRVMLKPNSQS